MTDWPTLHALIDGGDAVNVLRVVRNLDNAARKALAEPLRAYEKSLRTDTFVARRFWGARLCALTVAGAALLPGASGVAVWIARNGLREEETGDDVVDLVVDALRARDVGWLADLADRLALRLPADRLDPDTQRLVMELAAVTGIPPLATDGLVYAWIATGTAGTGTSSLARRLFEVDGIGPLLEAGGWPQRLADDPGLDRVTLLDGCLFRLRRGGRAADLSGFLSLHQALAPAAEEIAMLAGEYVALLSGPHTAVAAVAQDELLRADQAGKLPLDVLVAASRAVLARGDRKLVRAQLAWLDTVARRDPAAAGAVLRVLAAACAVDSADTRQRALAVLLKHIRRADGATRDEITAALPPQLRSTVTALTPS